MDVKNCRMCGRLYNHISGDKICPACKEKLEDQFQQVKEYIRENKNASFTMVAEENEVSIQQIKHWIREERLIFAEDSIVGVECEKCGAMIRTGRFCVSCKDKMANEMKRLVKDGELDIQEARNKREIRDKNSRMRFLDYDK